MTVRQGQHHYLPPHAYSPIDIHALASDFIMHEGETIEDVYQRLDPERAAHVLGVTENGEFDTTAVHVMGEKLFTNGQMGVDILVIPPGSGFPPHVHPGHHLLYCISGRGTFTLDQVCHEVSPGSLWMVEGEMPHAVGNPFDQPHIVVATGAPHRELDSPDRMRVVNWNGHPLHVPEERAVPPTPDHPYAHRPDPEYSLTGGWVADAVRAGVPGP